MELRTARIVSATFALAAFCVASLTGVLVGNPADAVLVRAIAAMGVCWVVGSVVGSIAQGLIARELEAHRLRNPADEVVLPGETPDEATEADASPRTPSRPGEEDILVV